MGQLHKILIVTEARHDQKYLERSLEGLGYKVATANSTKQVLSKTRAHSVDLVLLDLGIKEDGCELCSTLMEDPANENLPIILLVDESHQEDIMRGFDSGAVDYILKPFTDQQIQARVRTQLELTTTRRKLHQELEEHRATLVQLREEKQKADFINRFVPSAIFTSDLNRRITSWNKRAEEITGYSENEVMGKVADKVLLGSISNDNFLPSPSSQRVPIVNFEVVILTKHQSERTILFNLDFLRGTSGEITGWIQSFEDITMHKKASQQIKQQYIKIDEQNKQIIKANQKANEFNASLKKLANVLSEHKDNLEAIFNASSDAMLVVDMEGKVISANKFTNTLYGYDLDDIIGDSIYMLVHVGYHYVYGTFWEDIKLNGFSKIESVDMRDDGTSFYTETIGTKFVFNGEDHVLIMVRDISQIKIWKQAYEQSEINLIEAQHIAKIGNWAYYPESDDLTWSNEVYRILKLPKQKPSLSSFASFVHPDDKNVFFEAFKTLAHSFNQVDIELRISPFGKDYRYIKLAGKAIHTSGEEIKAIGTVQDITSLKVAEKEAKKRYDELVVAKDELQEYVSELQATNDNLYNTSLELEDINKKATEQNVKLTDITQKLQENEEQLRGVLDMLPIGIILFDSDQQVVYSNPAFEQCLNIPSGIFAGQYASDYEFISPEGTVLEHHYLPFNQVYNQGQVIQNAEVGIRKNNGNVVWTYINAAKLPFSSFNVVVAVQDITRKKEFELELRKLSKALEQSHACVVITSGMAKIEYVNPAFAKLTGYSFSEAMGKNPNILQGPSTPEEVYKDLWNTIKVQKQTWKGEFLNRKKNGELFWERASISPVLNNDGVITNYVAVKEDITAEKETQLILSIKDRALEASANSMAIADKNGVIIYANPSFLSLWNLSIDDACKMQLAEAWDNSHQFDSIYNKVKEDGKWFGEIVAKTFKNKKFNAQLSISLVKDERESVAYTLVSVIDISEKRMIEDRLRQSELKFRFLSKAAAKLMQMELRKQILVYLGEKVQQLVPRSLVSMHMVNLSKMVIETAEIFGVEKEEIMQSSEQKGIEVLNKVYTFPDTVFEEYPKNNLKYKQAGHTGLEFVDDIMELLGDTHPIQYLYGISLFTGDDLHVVFNIFTDQDILNEDVEFIETFIYQASIALQRRVLERKLLRAKEKAERANLAKSAFLANMSHEIRTPLNAVIGFSDLLVTEVHNPKQKGYLQSIMSSGRTLLDLINDILDLSKIDSGRIELNPKPFQISDLMHEVEHIFKQKAEQKKLSFSANVASDIPVLLLDEFRLRQVMINLIGNAIKFTEKGGVNIEVSFRKGYADTGKLNINVIDTGIGIPVEYQQVIFESFKQRDDHDGRKFGGTGLGLTISKRLVRMMNGNILIDSHEGKGSTFTVELQEVEVVGAAVKSPAKQSLTNPLTDYEFSEATILIADDVETNLLLLDSFLLRTPCTAIVAHNGAEAVDLAKQHLPNLILMDLRMPIMDGEEAAKELRKYPATSKIPIVAVTASSISETSAEEASLFDGYLRKPFKIKDFLELLSRFIPSKTHETQSNNSSKQLLPDHLISTIPEILKRIDQDYAQEFERVSQTHSFTDIERFAASLEELGQSISFPEIINIGKSLKECVNSFSLDGINENLNKFSQIVMQMRTTTR